MVQLPYLQPFEVVNKRVPRIGVDIRFIDLSLCPLLFIDVLERAYVESSLEVHELNEVKASRDVFGWANERVCQRHLTITQTMVKPDPLKIR